MSESEDPVNSPTLNSWKDIATYLGKSVRAVQRWERDFGLPVHRIKTPTGQVVYAFRSEIDSWRLAMRAKPQENLPELVAVGDPPARVPRLETAHRLEDESAVGMSSGPPTSPRRVWWVSVGTAAALILVAAGFLVPKTGALARTAASYEIIGTSLVALTEDRQRVWSHDFGWQPQALKYERPIATRTLAVDLDGDGRQELLAVIHAAGASGEPWRETIFCFSDTGTLRWSYTPSLKLTYEGRIFDGPWRNYNMAASTGAGRQRAWVSFGHHTWWPSFVVELDADGKPTPRYFQSGAIYSLAYWSAGSGNYLVASGVDNEYGRGSVAVLKVDAPATTSPQHIGSGFHCDSCPKEGPEFFAALPHTELLRLSGSPYNTAKTAAANGSDVKIYSEERAGDGVSGTASALYYLRDGFTFHDVALNDQYWQIHRKLERDGAISHSSKDCPDLRDPPEALTWTREHGWRQARVSIAPPATPLK